jgi:hypothetical protein
MLKSGTILSLIDVVPETAVSALNVGKDPSEPQTAVSKGSGQVIVPAKLFTLNSLPVVPVEQTAV